MAARVHAEQVPDLVGPELDSLGEQAQRVSFAAGDIIVAEGDPADRFYVIAHGEVTISRRSPEGDEMKLATLGRGQFFGEVGILADTRRTATVRALEPLRLFAVEREEFLFAVTGHAATLASAENIVMSLLPAGTLAG